MNFPENIEEVIGYSRIREIISNHCKTEGGKRLAETHPFLTHPTEIAKRQNETEECRLLMMQSTATFYFPAYEEMDGVFAGLRVEGSFTDAIKLLVIKNMALDYENAKKLILKKKIELPAIMEAAQPWVDVAPVAQKIEKVIDKEGQVKPNASKELEKLYRQLKSKEESARHAMKESFKKARENGYAADTEITIRNGRLVMPVLSDKKYKVQGFFHDESSGGKVVYIEPVECLAINNEVREIQYKMGQEINRILRELNAELAPYAKDLQHAYKFISFLDFTRAKSIFALDTNSSFCKLVPEKGIHLTNARHPLLYLNLHKSKKNTVPLSFDLDKNKKLLIISGPNAGGKSVALKTTALLQYMMQCGCLPTCDNNSTFSVFENMMVDLGDNQSIEQNLSSYSSHLLNMKHFMKHGHQSSLIFIDEMGTGTDPKPGGAMAEAIIEKLIANGVYGIITTHFGNLKSMANRYDTVLNGSMAYDSEKLEPLFILQTGKPGSSFAFEVASKTGIPADVVTRARKITGNTFADADQLMADLQAMKQKSDDEKHLLNQKLSNLNKLTDEYQKLKANIENRKSEIVDKARAEATYILKEANKMVETAVKQIKESDADKAVVQKTREHIEQTVKKHQSAIKKTVTTPTETKDNKPKDYQELPNETIAVGDEVVFGNQKNLSVVKAIKKQKAEIETGEMRLQVPVADLVKIKRQAAPKSKSNFKIISNLVERQMSFAPELDLRGVRGEEAIAKVQKFIDDAFVLGNNRLKIIHGRGDGILRKLIREYLKSQPRVLRYEHEKAEFGGDGATIVNL